MNRRQGEAGSRQHDCLAVDLMSRPRNSHNSGDIDRKSMDKFYQFAQRRLARIFALPRRMATRLHFAIHRPAVQ